MKKLIKDMSDEEVMDVYKTRSVAAQKDILYLALIIIVGTNKTRNEAIIESVKHLYID